MGRKTRNPPTPIILPASIPPTPPSLRGGLTPHKPPISFDYVKVASRNKDYVGVVLVVVVVAVVAVSAFRPRTAQV